MKVLMTFMTLISVLFIFCAISYKKGVPFDKSAVDKLVIQKTSKQEVISLLGQPYKRIIDKIDGYEKGFIYYHTLNGKQYDMLVIHFDKDRNIVTGYRAENGNIGSSKTTVHTYLP